MINNLGTPSSQLKINFGLLQIDTEKSASGNTRIDPQHENQNSLEGENRFQEKGGGERKRDDLG